MNSEKNSSSSPLRTLGMKSKRIESSMQNHNSNTLSDFNIVPSASSFASEKKIHDNNGGLQNLDFWKYIPAGFRFCPTEQELIRDYLEKKVMNEPLMLDMIPEVEVYQHNPDELSKEYKNIGQQEWYFFSPRDRRHANGKRPKRSAQGGYWNATGKDRSILCEGNVIGKWRTLVFCEGNRPNGKKTSWLMREYTLDEPSHSRTSVTDMKLDDWVLCKIYKNLKNYKSRATQPNNCENKDQNSVQEVDESMDSSGEQETDFQKEVSPELSQTQFEYNDNAMASDLKEEPINHKPPMKKVFTFSELMGSNNLMEKSLNINDHLPSSPEFTLPEFSQGQPQYDNLMMEPTQSNLSFGLTFPEMSEPQPQNNDVAATMDSESFNPLFATLTYPSDQCSFQGDMANFGKLPELESSNFASPWDHIYFD